MKCPECQGCMHKEEHVDDTSKADISSYLIWECEDCGNEIEIGEEDDDSEFTCGAMDRF